MKALTIFMLVGGGFFVMGCTDKKTVPQDREYSSTLPMFDRTVTPDMKSVPMYTREEIDKVRLKGTHPVGQETNDQMKISIED